MITATKNENTIAAEALTGIGNPGHARIRNIGNAFAPAQFPEKLGGAHGFVVLMQADQRFTDFQMREEHAGVAGVLAGNQIHFR